MTISRTHFSLFRIVFGSYLLWHFLALIPYAAELFSHEGVISQASLNPTYGIFPSHLFVWDSPLIATLTVILGALSALAFTLGYRRQVAAGILWFVLTALFHRNNLTANPSLPYVGLTLILTTLIPPAERWSLTKSQAEWHLPKGIITVATFLLALGYSFSGWTKLSSPSWTDGSALSHVLNNPLARPGALRDLLINLPDGFLTIATWAALCLELLYLPLAFHKRTAPWVWLAMVGMHISLVLMIDFADLSMGMLMIHAFTFNPQWIPMKKGKISLAFDTDCLMCNGFINWLAEEDKTEQLSFQGLPTEGTPQNTIIAVKEKVSLTHSSAIICAFEGLGGLWRALAWSMKLIPRPIRDVVYKIIAKNRQRFGKSTACSLPSPAVRKRLATTILPLCILTLTLTCSCSTQVQHNGLFPLNLMERPPGGNHLKKADAAFIEIQRYQAGAEVHTHKFREGDVIAFHMSKAEAGVYLRSGKIQKIPYSVFSYGHLAMLVKCDGEWRLLQLAMKESANADSDLSYLRDKNWVLYRPSSELDLPRLNEFVDQVLVNAADPKAAYDYTGALGIHNVSTKPNTLEDIADEYTCATLVPAALHYAGHKTNTVHRGGILDIVTPAQVIRAGKETELDKANSIRP